MPVRSETAPLVLFDFVRLVPVEVEVEVEVEVRCGVETVEGDGLGAGMVGASSDA